MHEERDDDDDDGTPRYSSNGSNNNGQRLQETVRMTENGDDESSDSSDTQSDTEEEEERFSSNDNKTMDNIILVPVTSGMLVCDVKKKPIYLSLSSSGMKVVAEDDEKISVSKREKADVYEISHAQCPRKSTTQGLKIKNQKSCCRTKANNGNQNEISEVLLDENCAPRATDNESDKIVEMDTATKHGNVCKRRCETYDDTVDDEYYDRNRIFKKHKHGTNDTSEECECQKRISKGCNNRIGDDCKDGNRISERHHDALDEECCKDPKKISKRDKDQTNHRQDERYGERSNERNTKVDHRQCLMTKEDYCQCYECQQRLQVYLKSLTDQEGKNSLLNNVEACDCNCNRCQSDTRLKTESSLKCSSNRQGNVYVNKMQNCCTSSSQALCGNNCSKIAVGCQHNKAHAMCSHLQLPEEAYEHTCSQPNNKIQINETDPIPNELSEENLSFSDFILAQNLTDTDPKEQLAQYARYLKREMKGKFKRFNSLATTFKDGLRKQDPNNDSDGNRHQGENETDDQSSKCVIM